MGVSRASARRAGAASPRGPKDPGARGLCCHRRAAIGHLPTANPGRLAPHRAHQREDVLAGLRPPVPLSRRRPGEVLFSTIVTPALHVEKPGLLTTVQDLGRPNAISAGVQAGGAMDRFAHSAANLLVGNDPGLATLECTLIGPSLVAGEACLVAITGADPDPRVNGVPAPAWTSLLLSPGDRLTFGGQRKG